MKATRTTEEMWVKRVEAWRASGETAEVFARREGYVGSTLHWWSSRLGRGAKPQFLRLVPKAGAVGADAVVADAGLVVEIGQARIRVEVGFDMKLLGDVVAALGGDR